MISLYFFFFRKQKETMINSRVELYEDKIKRLKTMYEDEIQEKNELLNVFNYFHKFIYDLFS